MSTRRPSSDGSVKTKPFMIKAILAESDVNSLNGSHHFEGYASTFGNTDRDGDIFEKGAFDNTLKSKNVLPLLFNHNRDSVIGKLEAGVNDTGLLVKGYLNFNDPKAQNVYELIKMGALDSMSIGFRVKNYDPVDSSRPFGGWLVKEAELFEVSVVTIPANDRALIQNVKSFDNQEEFYELLKKAVREVIHEEQNKHNLLEQINNATNSLSSSK